MPAVGVCGVQLLGGRAEGRRSAARDSGVRQPDGRSLSLSPQREGAKELSAPLSERDMRDALLSLRAPTAPEIETIETVDLHTFSCILG